VAHRQRVELSSRLGVYLVADAGIASRPLTEEVADAVDNGVTAVQLRAKTMTDGEQLAIAIRLATICHSAGALFFVNDRVDLALASGADGVHLGVDDLPIEIARRIGGEGLVIGYSPATDQQSARAKLLGADYLGVGPIFGTVSKADAGPPIGLDGLRRRSQIAGIPVIGIGGIDSRNAADVIGAEAVGVAVASAILRSDDPGNAARMLSETVRQALSKR
jgi:thiamine-phosphate pyrophosphorylase